MVRLGNSVRGQRALVRLVALALLIGACAGGTADEPVAGFCDLADSLDQAGQLTVATAAETAVPWVFDDDPTRGRGFEAALVYQLADEMGIDAVVWTTSSREEALAPGGKDFDFAIQQLPITAEAEAAVDFSNSYYQVQQVVIGSPDGEAAVVESLAALRSLSLGVLRGTTGVGYVETEVAPAAQPQVFDDAAAATAALESGDVDAVILGLPDAYALAAADPARAAILAVLPRVDEAPIELAMVFEESSPLVACVNDALAALLAEGKLAQLEAEWLNQQGRIPLLTP